jgi:hypothetical protein
MPGTSGTPRLRRLRLTLLLACAIGLVAQSMLAVVGEMHEVVAHGELSHGHSSHHEAHQHDADHHEAPDTEDPDHEGGGTLHVLLHHAHSCSHCAWMSEAQTPLMFPGRATAALPSGSASYLPGPGLTAPFRPPIQA